MLQLAEIKVFISFHAAGLVRKKKITFYNPKILEDYQTRVLCINIVVNYCYCSAICALIDNSVVRLLELSHVA